ncbi:hypothetical protein G7077_09935 [Sphingomonas piscis]|uniref:Uncharacterized protein n=1 Tax=Sphingomonas piscis TaxID=2714943 RepID=A0A6G7YQZ2_9SPHN|nr:hypothetical protein [Sphingomonas piscis]QIK79168.1 hypothetical protein G7077_09935 [Sphingomonas piscis]
MIRRILCKLGWHSEDRAFIGKRKSGRVAYRYYCNACAREFTTSRR